MSEETLFREIEEDLQRDRLQKLARKYGAAAAVLVVLVVAGTAGTVAYNGWRAQAREEGTARLAEAVLASGAQGGDAAIAALKAYAGRDEGERTMLARLIGAGIEARTGDPAAAAEIYGAVAADGGVAAPYRELATLLAVTHELATGDPQQLQTRLAPLTEAGSPWRYTAMELTALLAAKAGDAGRAARLFQELAQAEGAPPALRGRAEELAALYGKNG